MTLTKKPLLNVGITTSSLSDILEYVFDRLQNSYDNFYIVTPNPEILVYANSHAAFNKILNHARIAIPDGIGLVRAAQLLGQPISSTIPGVDLMDMLCKTAVSKEIESVKKPIKIGLLGGRGNVAEKTAECLRKKYPGIEIVFVGEEWPKTIEDLEARVKIYDSRFKNEMQNLINHKSNIIKCYIDLLFVAYGFPKQEEWMSENLGRLPVRVMMGVGGAFDYISGRVPRAPYLVRIIGFEWLFRLIVQPWRIKRQLALFTFVLLVLRQRLS